MTLKEVSMNRRTFCTLLVFLLLNACAPTITPMQQELMSKAMPMYEGQFSPIQVPVQLEYKPVSMNLAGHFAVHTSIRDKDEVFSGELYGRLRVSPKGDFLLWEFKLENTVLGEQKRTSSAPPLVEFRALRDRHGVTKEGELTITAMKAKSPEENLQVEELKALLLAQFKSLSAELPTLPIQSGTPLLEIDMKPALQAFEKLWGSPRYSPPKEKIGYSTRGFGSLKGRKVIVAVLDEDFICVAKNERRYSFGMHAYALLDADTAQILEGKMMTTVKSLYSFDSIEFRMLQRVSAEIME
jgi:hypothetical protein